MNQTLDRNELVQKMNLTNVPVDVQDQIIAQFGENVIKSVTLEVISKLSEDGQAVFEKLLQSDDQTKLEKFLEEKVPNFDELLKAKADAQIEAVRKAMTE